MLEKRFSALLLISCILLLSFLTCFNVSDWSSTRAESVVVCSSTYATADSSAETPLWAFDRAYAEYGINYSLDNGFTVQTVNYTISNVNVTAQTMDIQVDFLGPAWGGWSVAASISNPYSGTYPIQGANSTTYVYSPVVSQSDLALLNQGQVPSDMSGAQIVENVSVTVPARSFTTDEVTLAGGGTEWVDRHTGLIVQLSGNPAILMVLGEARYLNVSQINAQLVATNIPKSGGLGYLPYAVLAVVVVAFVSICFFFARRKHSASKPLPATASPPTDFLV
jgi:hypothetical protein